MRRNPRPGSILPSPKEEDPPHPGRGKGGVPPFPLPLGGTSAPPQQGRTKERGVPWIARVGDVGGENRFLRARDRKEKREREKRGMEDTRERSRSRSRSPPEEGGKEERRYGGNRKGRGGRRRNRPHVGTQHHPGSGGPFGPPGFFPTAYASNYPGGGTHPGGWPGPTPQEGYVNETNTTQTMQPTCARARDPTRGGKKQQRRMGPWHACVPRRRPHG